MAERSKALRSGRSLLWRRGFESHFWQCAFNLGRADLQKQGFSLQEEVMGRISEKNNESVFREEVEEPGELEVHQQPRNPSNTGECIICSSAVSVQLQSQGLFSLSDGGISKDYTPQLHTDLPFSLLRSDSMDV